MTTDTNKDLTLTKELHIITLNINGYIKTKKEQNFFKIYIMRTSI